MGRDSTGGGGLPQQGGAGLAVRATGFDGDEVARRLELREASGIGGGKELDGSDSPHGWESSA